ncbi:MAG: serine hydrolase [Stenomitos frigidus ULC029]
MRWKTYLTFSNWAIARSLKQLLAFLVTLIWITSLAVLPVSAQEQGKNNQFLLLSPPGSEQTEPKATTSPASSQKGPQDPQEVEAFLDKFFTNETPKEHVPGAVVALVKEGKILFTKGYGYANVEKKIPVVPDRTLFRVASLSKLFTDTAVMQMYERGLLNLHTDVNQYLKRFQIKNPYEEPITAARLMIQTDGTSQRLLGIAAPTAAEMQPLSTFIPTYMPPIVQPPGKLYSYSNMGITLAGYLVEVLSGTPFVDYMDKNLLQPLEMQRSSFRQPLPPALASDLAVGYQYKNGKFQPVPFLYLNIAPAASLSATATDMAHFMIAHLQKGRYENSQILQEDTARKMHRQQFSQHPLVPGTGYGFHERLENNIRAIGHVGSLRGYSSSLTLLPEQNVGLFIASNNFNGMHGKLITQFFDHYYPVKTSNPTPQAPRNINDRLDRFTGTYRDLEYPRDTLGKLTAPFGHLHVKAGDNGTLVVQTPGLFFPTSIVEKRLAPVEPLLFQRLDDDGYSAFGEDEQGQIAYVFNPIGAKIGTFEKIPWYETIVFQGWLAGACIVLFLAALLSSIGSWLGWFGKQHHAGAPKLARVAWLVMALVSGLYLLFLIGLPLSLWLMGVWKLVYGLPAIAVAFLYLPPIAASLSIALPVFALLAWKRNYWSAWERSLYSLTTLAALVFIPFLLYWNLLGGAGLAGS